MKSESTNLILIVAGTVAVLYFVNQAGAEVGSGIGTGAELAGGGVGIAAIAATFLILL